MKLQFGHKNLKFSNLLSLFIPFIWLFICLYLALKYFLKLISRKYRKFPPTRQTSLAFVLSIVPICMLMLRSIDQLTIRDGLILLVLVSFGAFYVSRLSIQRRT